MDSAVAALRTLHTRHYEALGTEEVRARLETLFDKVLAATASRDLGPIVAYAHRLAEERFAAGVDLSEVQTALNVLEEAAWMSAFASLQPDLLAGTLGLLSTVLGAAKDELARRYVALATQTHVPSLDLRALFAGTDR